MWNLEVFTEEFILVVFVLNPVVPLKPSSSFAWFAFLITALAWANALFAGGLSAER